MAARVPYLGPIRMLKDSGPRVILYKRALAKAGYFKGRTSGPGAGYPGPFFASALKKFAAARLVPNVKDGVLGAGHHRAKAWPWTGELGPHLHVKLAPYFDAYGASRMQAILRRQRVAAIIGAMVNAMRLVVAQRSHIYYSQVYRGSGIRYGRVPPAYGTEEDCSSERAWVCWVGDLVARTFGWRVPNPTYAGGTYEVIGNTTSERENPHVGDLGSFAEGIPGLCGVHYLDPDHVASKFTSGTVEEMGSNPGPLQVPPTYRRVYRILTTYILDETGARAA